MNALAEYLADNYGTCAERKCQCLRFGWRGRGCPHWRPCGARTWDELRQLQEEGLRPSVA